mmetsp:Transcript_87/g.113  ORF Transcript_87/g.113 Transcript_87/m.113 type:complete len:372 (-) Transcript_87:164-1279(-)
MCRIKVMLHCLLALLALLRGDCAATLTINGRTLTVVGMDQAHKQREGPDPADLLQFAPGGRQYACHSLDFSPEMCGIFFGRAQVDPRVELSNALRDAVISTREIEIPGTSTLMGTDMAGTQLEGEGEGDASRASMAATYPRGPTGGEEPSVSPQQNPHAEGAPRNPEQQQQQKTSGSNSDGGMSFVLDELFGGPRIGATDKAKQLKMLILGGARIHGGSIRVVRGAGGLAGGRRQVIEVGLTSEILLRLIELAEKEVGMKEALSIITQSVSDSIEDDHSSPSTEEKEAPTTQDHPAGEMDPLHTPQSEPVDTPHSHHPQANDPSDTDDPHHSQGFHEPQNPSPQTTRESHDNDPPPHNSKEDIDNKQSPSP